MGTLFRKGSILNSYVVPCFDVFHTQSKDYIVEDILAVMKEEGVTVYMRSRMSKTANCGRWFSLFNITELH